MGCHVALRLKQEAGPQTNFPEHPCCTTTGASSALPTPSGTFHISEQLANGVDVFLLAKNTGTNPDMIEKHYGQVKLDRVTDHLRPEWTRA